MKYVVDTNIISEIMRPAPDHNTVWWMQDHNEDIFLNAVSIEEVYYGIFLLPEGRRKERFKDHFDAIVKECSDRILPFDSFCGYLCAQNRAASKRAGKPVSIEDCIIAAICQRHDAVLVTRNVKDFEHFDLQVINPFSYELESPPPGVS